MAIENKKKEKNIIAIQRFIFFILIFCFVVMRKGI